MMRCPSIGMNALALLVGVAGCAAPSAPLDTMLEAEFDTALGEFDQAQQMQRQDPDRARQLFKSAAQRLESIVASGITNGRLEFNLANCHLQAGDVGKAVLHYKRAQRLIPRDSRLADNLAEARSRCLTTVRESQGSAVLRNVFFWHHDTSVVERSTGAISLYVLFWILLLIRNFVPRRGLGISIIVVAALAVVLSGSLGAQRWLERRLAEGVVTTMDVTVYKGPGSGYQRQFEQPLQPGTEFTVLEERPGWLNVRLADGKSGWIDSASAEFVLPHRPTGAG